MEPQTFNDAIPLEILTAIFTFLPRRDRFICMCMCSRWRDAMNVSILWRHMSVKLDVDFFEISTIQLTIEYCNYIKSLELQFENPEEPLQWVNYRMVDVTKRVYRFLSIFVNKNLQINSLSFTNFCDFYKSKKILYYLSMFLRSQYKIKTISCNGSHFSKKSLIKILTCSIAANHSSIKYLDIQNSYNEDTQALPADYNLLSSQLMICLSNINNLTVFKIDLVSLLCNNVLEGFLNGCCETLEFMDVRITDLDISCVSHTRLFSCNMWIDLRKKFKKLKVSLLLYNIVTKNDFMNNFLMTTLPLHCVSWICTDELLKDLFELTIRRYMKLEIIKINAVTQTLDDLLIFATCNCLRLKCLEFSGIITDLGFVQDTFEQSNFSGFKSYQIYLRNATDGGFLLSKVKVLKRNGRNDELLCVKGK